MFNIWISLFSFFNNLFYLIRCKLAEWAVWLCGEMWEYTLAFRGSSLLFFSLVIFLTYSANMNFGCFKTKQHRLHMRISFLRPQKWTLADHVTTNSLIFIQGPQSARRKKISGGRSCIVSDFVISVMSLYLTTCRFNLVSFPAWLSRPRGRDSARHSHSTLSLRPPQAAFTLTPVRVPVTGTTVRVKLVRVERSRSLVQAQTLIVQSPSLKIWWKLRNTSNVLQKLTPLSLVMLYVVTDVKIATYL